MNNKLPKYDKYKPSGVEWLGEIPEHWEVSRLKNHIDLITGFPFKSEKYTTEGIKLARGINVKEGVFNWDETRCWASIESHLIKFLLEEGDVLIAMDGSKVGKNFCKVQKSDLPILLLQRVARLRVKQTLNANYLFNHIQNKNFLSWVEMSKTDPMVPHIAPSDIENFIILVPPLIEQIRIAEFLDRKTTQIDQAIGIKEKQIALLKERRQLMIHRAVTRGINPDIKLKPSGVEWIGDIPEHWEVKKLRYVGKCQNGISKGGEYFGSGYPFVSYSDVYKNIELPKTVNGLAESTEADRKQYSVEEGDVFFTRTSETVEEIAFASTCSETIDNATFAGFLIRFRPQKNILFKGFSKFYFSSQTHRAFFVKEMNLVIRASLSQELLNRMPILVPPIQEQIAIATHIETLSSKIATAISLKEQEIAKLKEYKSVLINGAVTGKVKVG